MGGGHYGVYTILLSLYECTQLSLGECTHSLYECTQCIYYTHTDFCVKITHTVYTIVYTPMSV